MTTAAYVLAVFLIVAAGAYILLGGVVGIRTWLKYRGQRLVTCPETRKPAAVDVEARRAALGVFLGRQQLRLGDCSRWPERQGCGQDCLQEVEADPEKCLVWNIVNKWYAGKECAYCHKPFGVIHWHDRRPALMSADRKTVQWDEVPAEKLPEVFATHMPVCWNCHIAETFRREHPDLVVDRNLRRAG